MAMVDVDTCLTTLSVKPALGRPCAPPRWRYMSTSSGPALTPPCWSLGLSIPLCSLPIARHAKGWSRGQVEDILREQRGEGVHNVPLGHHPRGAALVVKQRDVAVAAKAHLIQGVDEVIVHMQTLGLGGHQRAH